MSAPWWTGVRRRQDPHWRVVFLLMIILAVVGSLFIVFIVISVTLGCGTVGECANRLGFGIFFSEIPCLWAFCVGFIIIAVVMAIVGAMYWGVIFDRRGANPYIRKRLPPE